MGHHGREPGYVFVALESAHNLLDVLVFEEVLGTARAGRGEGLFDRPEGVEIRDADVWFSDTYNNRIVRYRALVPGG